MGSLIPRSSPQIAARPVSARTNRALSKVEEGTLVRSAEIQGIAEVGQTALRGVAEVSMAEEELAKLSPPGARLRLSAIGDATTAAIQCRVMDLMDGL